MAGVSQNPECEQLSGVENEGMHSVKRTESLLCKRKSPVQTPIYLANSVHVNCVPGVPRAFQTGAPLYCGTRHQRVTGMSLSPEAYKSHRPCKASVCAVLGEHLHRCSLSQPGMQRCPCTASQHMVQEGWAVELCTALLGQCIPSWAGNSTRSPKLWCRAFATAS